RAPATSPSPRAGVGLAFDAARGRVVLFGGYAISGETLVYYSDTWEWDGATWAPRATATGPSARSGHAMTYDATRQQVVLHGGSTSSGLAGDTWTFAGGAWSQRS